MNRIYKKAFVFEVQRFEEYIFGTCTNKREISCIITAIPINDNLIKITLNGNVPLGINQNFTLPILGIEQGDILEDRVQYGRLPVGMNCDDSNKPIVCNIFDNMTCIRFAMMSPLRIIEFFGEFKEIGKIEQNSTYCDINFPINFKSPGHQRYEKEIPVMGLQKGCVRTITIEENINGCPGYDIEHGRGYIVKIFNNDIGQKNMSDKPMDLISKDSEKIVFRGYPLYAMSPFGWQEVDYSNYGFVVYLNNGQIEKCSLFMYDRDVRIDYLSDEILQNL